jgi:diguanylate cyclase (GGDEF)-like protein
MTVLAIAMYGIASTNLLLAIALYAAFLRFGRGRHAIWWALAFATFTVLHLAMAVRMGLPGQSPGITLVSTVASLLGATFVALGFRERSALTDRRAIIAAFAGTSLLCGVLVLMYPAHPVHHPIASAYGAAMLFLSIRALRKGPEEGLAAGRVTLAMMIVFLAFFVALTMLSLMTVPWGPLRPDLYHACYILGVPANLMGIGLFALFLLAEDLAHGMRNLAIVDPLTGLLNRRGFEEAAQRVTAQCRRSGVPVCIAVADLDHFKSINDRFGHPAGDRALSECAGRLRGALREGDLLGRLGGEEFVLLLPGVGTQGVGDLLDRLRAALPGREDRQLLGFPMPTCSFGAVEIGAQDALASSIGKADAALYQAKRDGRDCVRVAGEAIPIRRHALS